MKKYPLNSKTWNQRIQAQRKKISEQMDNLSGSKYETYLELWEIFRKLNLDKVTNSG